MKYQKYSPHPTLQDHVKCFWMLERAHSPDDPDVEMIPDACIELIFNFGAPYVLHAAGRPAREMTPVFLVGLQQKPLLFRSGGTVKLVATRFHAWGAGPFLAIQAQTPNRAPVTLDRDWRDLARRLETKVQADDYGGAIAGLEDFLVGRLLTATVELKQIQLAARMLAHRQGQFRVTDLAEYCGLSARQLQRRFRQVVGVSPKALARSMRFEAIRNRLMFDPDAKLTDVAHDFGYTDQAHSGPLHPRLQGFYRQNTRRIRRGDAHIPGRSSRPRRCRVFTILVAQPGVEWRQERRLRPWPGSS